METNIDDFINFIGATPNVSPLNNSLFMLFYSLSLNVKFE
jgi:hypothetical protein